MRGTTRGFGDISADPTTAVSDITLRGVEVAQQYLARARLVARGVSWLEWDIVRVNGAPAIVEG